MISINGTEISFKGRFLSVGEIEGPAQVNFSLFEARTEVSCSLSALQAVGFAARIRWRKANKFVIARALCARGNLGKALPIRTGCR